MRRLILFRICDTVLNSTSFSSFNLEFSSSNRAICFVSSIAPASFVFSVNTIIYNIYWLKMEAFSTASFDMFFILPRSR